MKWIADIKTPQEVHCVIEHSFLYARDNRVDGEAYYLYVTGDGIAEDFMQDTLEFAKQDALEYYRVPLDAWVQVE